MATYSSIAHNFTPPAATTSAQVGAGAKEKNSNPTFVETEALAAKTLPPMLSLLTLI